MMLKLRSNDQVYLALTSVMESFWTESIFRQCKAAWAIWWTIQQSPLSPNLESISWLSKPFSRSGNPYFARNNKLYFILYYIITTCNKTLWSFLEKNWCYTCTSKSGTVQEPNSPIPRPSPSNPKLTHNFYKYILGVV